MAALSTATSTMQSAVQSTYMQLSKDETIVGRQPVAVLHQGTPGHMTLLQSLRLGCCPGESSFELVKFKLSSELKTKALNIRTSFNIPYDDADVAVCHHSNKYLDVDVCGMCRHSAT